MNLACCPLGGSFAEKGNDGAVLPDSIISHKNDLRRKNPNDYRLPQTISGVQNRNFVLTQPCDTIWEIVRRANGKKA
jgi:hypothetical protein